MTEPDSPVDPRDIEVLRGDATPTRAARDRARSKLAAVIPSMGAAAAAGAAGQGGPAARPSGVTGASAKLVAAFLVGGALGAALHAGLTKEPAARIVYLERPTPVVPVAPPPSEPAVQSAPPMPAAAPDSAPATHASAPRSHASQLSAERMMLDEARSSLVQGDARGALEVLERHRHAFPSPLLGEERDALGVQALVKAGRFDEARSRAESFRRRSPDSLFLPMVDAAIRSIP